MSAWLWLLVPFAPLLGAALRHELGKDTDKSS